MRTFKEEVFLTEGFNKGDMFEFVFSAACVSRFTDRNTDGSEAEINRKSVRDVMTAYFVQKQHWTVESADGATDYIEFETAAIPEGAMSRLSDSDYRTSKEVDGMIDRAIDAVENKKYKISKMATEVITNGIEDEIIIKPVGTSDQSGTKSDVDIVWVNAKKRLRISLKFNSGQFGQFASSNMVGALSDAWSSLGMPMSSANKSKVSKVLPRLYGNTKTYFDRDEDPKVHQDKEILFGAVKGVFRNIARSYDAKWMSSESNVKNIIAGFKKSIQGKEDDLEAVLTVGSKTQVVDKRNLLTMKKNLIKHAEKGSLKWELIEANENPTLALKAGNLTVFQVRFRWDLDKKKPGQYKMRTRTLIQITTDFFKFMEL